MQTDQTKIEEMENRINDLEEKIGKLAFPLDDTSQEIIKRIVGDSFISKFPDILWDNLFYYSTYFGISDAALSEGWGLADSSTTPSTGNSFQGVGLATGSTLNDETSIGKEPIYQDVLSYDEPSRIRTAIHLSSVSDVEFNFTIGIGGNGATTKHYGFLVVGNKLYGISGDGTSQTKKELTTLIASTSYLLEARFSPKNNVIFYLKNSNDNKLYEAGSITTNLPSGTFTKWVEYSIITRAAAWKQVNISFFEYMQRKQRF